MTTPKSNELLAADIAYIKADIVEIKAKLDDKYVSHETFDLIVKGIEERARVVQEAVDAKFNFILRVAILIGSPLYVAVITLVIKAFTS